MAKKLPEFPPPPIVSRDGVGNPLPPLTPCVPGLRDAKFPDVRIPGVPKNSILSEEWLVPNSLTPKVFMMAGTAVLIQNARFLNRNAGSAVGSSLNVYDIQFDDDPGTIQFDPFSRGLTTGSLLSSDIAISANYTLSNTFVGQIPQLMISGFSFGKITITPYVANVGALRLVVFSNPVDIRMF